jgi:hypothetical protein
MQQWTESAITNPIMYIVLSRQTQPNQGGLNKLARHASWPTSYFSLQHMLEVRFFYDKFIYGLSFLYLQRYC